MEDRTELINIIGSCLRTLYDLHKTNPSLGINIAIARLERDVYDVYGDMAPGDYGPYMVFNDGKDDK